ncbi:MAG: peptidylprolyl isomerase [Ginsengibacter sp.]|jgi:peptidyl-prolyl cis-trans isomerase SurA
MKKEFLFILLLPLFFSANSQTVFTYGNHSVDKSEFLRVYHKNKTEEKNKKKAMEDYLNLYSIFKLKVQAAKDLRFDTSAGFKADVQNFRSQIEESYLIDKEKVSQLVHEAFLRSQKDIHVVDYYIEIDSPDSAASLKKINQFYQALHFNPRDAVNIIAKMENEKVKISTSDFGYITVFSLPYSFENIVYRLKPGEIGKPYRTKKGWHILYNKSDRPAVGRIQVAQILIAAPKGSENLWAKAKNTADSLFNLLHQGADFGMLARYFSNDKVSSKQEGLMPEFGIGQYSVPFEIGAFSLKKDGDISEPVETEFGFHIIKRISSNPVPSKESDEGFQKYLLTQVLSDSRMEMAQKSFLQRVFIKTHYQKMPLNELSIWRVIDSSLMENRKVTLNGVNEKTVLISFNDGATWDVADWIIYLRNSDKVVPGHLHESYQQLWPQFVSFAVIDNYKKRLQEFDNDFKNQMNEFTEGNLLFEIMQKNVWEKATSDSVGLLNFYNQNKEKYRWNASADAIIFSCINTASAQKAIDQLNQGKTWAMVLDNNVDWVQADSGRYEIQQIPLKPNTQLNEGMITAPLKNNYDQTASFVKVIKIYLGKELRSFEEARGLVINDYQNYIEQEWVTQLKKKYPIKINEKVFQELLKNPNN